MSKDFIEPRLPSGFRDLEPKLALARQRMIKIIDEQYRLIGSVPLETPAVEYEEVLIGAEDFSKQLYRVVRRGTEEGEEEEKNPLALRFDLTVPLARYLSEHTDTPLPFIRHQLAQVWRGERKQQGRYREFAQFDLDIVGSASLAADAQVIAVMYNTLKALGVEKFVIKFSHRGLLEALFVSLSITSNKWTQIFNILDKLDKLKPAEVADLLVKAGLQKDQTDSLMKWVVSDGAPSLDKKVKESDYHVSLQKALDEVNLLKAYVADLGIPSTHVQFHPSIIRGLGYYTGPVWETVLLDAPEFGSVYSGGRYDNLLSRFGNRHVPATGTSIGVDRLFSALQKIGALDLSQGTTQVMVTNLDEEFVADELKFVSQLREAKIITEFYLGKDRGLGQQLGYAESKGAKVAVIYGAKEKEQGVVQIKDLAKREQKEIKVSDLVSEVKKILMP